MPGSKTFTSQKGVELFKAELIEALNTINEESAKKTKHTVTWEILKAISSGIIVKVILDSNKVKTFSICKTVFITILSLAVIYLLLTAIEKIVPNIKKDAKKRNYGNPEERDWLVEYYHSVIENQHFLALSFENKFSNYIDSLSTTETPSWNDRIHVDLCLSYLSQAIYYHSKSLSNYKKRILHEQIDKETQDFYHDIGIPHQMLLLESGYNSCTRISELIDKNTDKQNVSKSSNEAKDTKLSQLKQGSPECNRYQNLFSQIKTLGYSDNLVDLQHTVDKLIVDFESCTKNIKSVKNFSGGQAMKRIKPWNSIIELSSKIKSFFKIKR